MLSAKCVWVLAVSAAAGVQAAAVARVDDAGRPARVDEMARTTRSNLVNQMKASTVWFQRLEDDAGRRAVLSGVMVAPCLVATVHHGLEWSGGAGVVDAAGRTARVIGIVGKDPFADIAIVQVDRPVGKPVAAITGFDQMWRGMTVHAWLRDPDVRELRGQVSGPVVEFQTLANRSIDVRIATVSGDSGTPVFDGEGRLFGILYASLRNPVARSSVAPAVGWWRLVWAADSGTITPTPIGNDAQLKAWFNKILDSGSLSLDERANHAVRLLVRVPDGFALRTIGASWSDRAADRYDASLRDIMKAHPTWDPPVSELIVRRIKQGAVAEARVLLGLLKGKDEEARALFLAARAGRDAQSLTNDEQLDLIERVLQLAPEHDEGWRHLGYLGSQMGQHKLTIRAAEGLARAKPLDPDRWFLLGETLGRDGDPSLLEEAERRLRALDVVMYGRLRLMLGRDRDPE